VDFAALFMRNKKVVFEHFDKEKVEKLLEEGKDLQEKEKKEKAASLSTSTALK
jgi:hypothetical protein